LMGCAVWPGSISSGLTLEREGNRLARCPLLFQGKTWALGRVVSIIYRRARRSLPAADVIICVRSSCRAKGKKNIIALRRSQLDCSVQTVLCWQGGTCRPGSHRAQSDTKERSYLCRLRTGYTLYCVAKCQRGSGCAGVALCRVVAGAINIRMRRDEIF
jgi:hypothetical protein